MMVRRLTGEELKGERLGGWEFIIYFTIKVPPIITYSLSHLIIQVD